MTVPCISRDKSHIHTATLRRTGDSWTKGARNVGLQLMDGDSDARCKSVLVAEMNEVNDDFHQEVDM